VRDVEPRSQLIAEGLDMIGAHAGCRHPDRVRVYVDNLTRLGVIRFSGDAIEDPITYQVLEAQPEALEVLKSTARARAVQRSLTLTSFGRGLCEVCLPLGEAELKSSSDR